jgi:hypothetical protein
MISSVCWRMKAILYIINSYSKHVALARHTNWAVRCSFSLLSRLACQSVSVFLSRRMMWEVIIEQVPQSNLQRLRISQTYTRALQFFMSKWIPRKWNLAWYLRSRSIDTRECLRYYSTSFLCLHLTLFWPRGSQLGRQVYETPESNSDSGVNFEDSGVNIKDSGVNFKDSGVYLTFFF